MYSFHVALLMTVVHNRDTLDDHWSIASYRMASVDLEWGKDSC